MRYKHKFINDLKAPGSLSWSSELIFKLDRDGFVFAVTGYDYLPTHREFAELVSRWQQFYHNRSEEDIRELNIRNTIEWEIERCSHPQSEHPRHGTISLVNEDDGGYRFRSRLTSTQSIHQITTRDISWGIMTLQRLFDWCRDPETGLFRLSRQDLDGLSQLSELNEETFAALVDYLVRAEYSE